MPWTLPLTAVIVAGFVEFTGWGKGTLNWGPRVGSLLLLVFGDVAFRATFAGDWLNRGVDYAASWVDRAVAYFLGASAGHAAGALVSWLPFALLAAYWIVAWSPWGGERMTWRLAWAGMFIPVFVTHVPGFAGGLLTTVVHFAISAGVAIVAGLFALKGAVT